MTKPEYPTPNPSKWPPFLRKNNRQKMPWGYKPNPDNDLETLPDPYMIGLLEEVFVHIDNGESYRKSAEWVSARAGKSISYQTISNLWTKSRKRKRNILKKESNKKLAEVRRPKTKTEAKEQEIRKKMSAAKRSMTVSKNKLHKLHEETKDDPETPTINISDTLDHESVPQERTIIFEPNKGPQTEFLASSEREVLFGGAAGGGKSYSLLADPLRYFHNSNLHNFPNSSKSFFEPCENILICLSGYFSFISFTMLIYLSLVVYLFLCFLLSTSPLLICIAI